MNDELIQALKYLRMPNLLACWDDYLALAKKGRFSAVRLLTHMLEEEYKAKR